LVKAGYPEQIREIRKRSGKQSNRFRPDSEFDIPYYRTESEFVRKCENERVKWRNRCGTERDLSRPFSTLILPQLFLSSTLAGVGARTRPESPAFHTVDRFTFSHSPRHVLPERPGRWSRWHRECLTTTSCTWGGQALRRCGVRNRSNS